MITLFDIGLTTSFRILRMIAERFRAIRHNRAVEKRVSRRPAGRLPGLLWFEGGLFHHRGDVDPVEFKSLLMHGPIRIAKNHDVRQFDTALNLAVLSVLHLFAGARNGQVIMKQLLRKVSVIQSERISVRGRFRDEDRPDFTTFPGQAKSGSDRRQNRWKPETGEQANAAFQLLAKLGAGVSPVSL